MSIRTGTSVILLGLIVFVTHSSSKGHEVVRVTKPGAKGSVEVSVAIDPTDPNHIVAVSIQAGVPGAPYTSNYAYVSNDGGKKWQTVPAPNPGRRVQGDDVVTFSRDGIAFHTYIAFDGIFSRRPPRGMSGIFMSASRDGLVWSEPVAVIDHINSPAPHEDKPYPAIDNNPDSPHRGNVYVTWTRFDQYGSKDPEHKTHIYATRSRDGGRTFTVPHRISTTPGDCIDSSKTVMGAVPAVGTKGEVYVAWAGPNGISFATSGDGGWEYTKEKTISDLTPGWDLPVAGVGRHNGLPSFSVDHSQGPSRGTIYLNWIDKRNGDLDVFLRSSRDGGATWSEPIRVNDDPKGNGKQQMFSWLTVDRADGSINIIFFDQRDLEGEKACLILARSVNGGKTFVNHRIRQEPFALDKSVFFGDYIGVDSLGGKVVAVYPHFIEKKQVALSAALFQFKPGTQEEIEKPSAIPAAK